VPIKNARRVLLCAGKVYYDLIKRREAMNCNDISVVRMEQWYPFPKDQLAAIVGSIKPKQELVYVQEEPHNMGAWTFLEGRLRELFGREVEYVGRPAAATPATGSHHTHDIEQNHILTTALAPEAPAGAGNTNGGGSRKKVAYRQ